MKIQKWKEISKEFEGGSIILGNGASIAIDDSFAYHNLYRFTRDKRMISPDVIKVFEHFETENFEYILRMLWHGYNINLALGIDGETPINKAYYSIKDSLINAIKDKGIHASYERVSSYFDTIYKFLMNFETAVSLNYDLIVYWTMMYANNKAGIGQWFKDCFCEGEFIGDWEFLRVPNGGATRSTLVFYPHGNLILKEQIFTGEEHKISRTDETSLLDIFDGEWDDAHIPIFVSEGHPGLKNTRIEKSNYLSNVYKKVLPDLGEKIVIHGWSMSDEDDHILEQIARNKSIKKITLSVKKDKGFEKKLQKRVVKIKGVFPEINAKDIAVYDAESEGCWNNESKIVF